MGMLKKFLTLDTFKWVFLGAIILSAGYVAYSAILKQGGHSDRSLLPQGAFERQGEGLKPARVDYKQFITRISSKDVFADCGPRQSAVQPELQGKKLEEIKGSLRLSGIIAGDPMKVMIEDKNKGESFYLKEGEVFLEDISVERIDKDSVILRYYDEEFKLDLF